MTYNPNQHTRMEQDGALEDIVRERVGGPRMALEAACVQGGAREDVGGAQSMLVAIWGVDEVKWDEQMAQDIMGSWEHMWMF